MTGMNEVTRLAEDLHQKSLEAEDALRDLRLRTEEREVTGAIKRARVANKYDSLRKRDS